MGNGPSTNMPTNDRGHWLLGALWRRRVGILLAGAASAGTALGLCGLLLPAEPSTRIILMDRGFAAAGPVAGSTGEIAPVAAHALASGFQASSDLLAGRDPARPAVERLVEILRSAPLGSGQLLNDARSGEFVRAAREVFAPGSGAMAGATPRVLADLGLPAQSVLASPALPVAALAGVAGLLASSLYGIGAERKTRRRRLAENRWAEPELEGLSATENPAARPLALSSSEIELSFDEPSLRVEIEDEPSAQPELQARTAIVVDLVRLDAISADEATLVFDDAPNQAATSDAGEETLEATIIALPRPVSIMPAMEAEDIAEVALAVGLTTMLVVEAGEGERSCASVDLVRALAARGSAAILLDLGFDRVLADDLGVAEAAAGLSDLLTGAADIGSVIHRDSAGSADLIVWGRDGTGDPLQAERLDDLFATLGQVYDCIVIAGGATSLRSLTGLLGETGAAVVAMGLGGEDGAGTRMAELELCGEPDSLLMSAYPRNLRLIAEAA